MESCTGKDRREQWREIWLKSLAEIQQKGVLIEVQRNGAIIYRANPAMKELERAEKMLIILDKEYGTEVDEIPSAIDPEVVLGARQVGRSSSERRARGQSASRKRR